MYCSWLRNLVQVYRIGLSSFISEWSPSCLSGSDQTTMHVRSVRSEAATERVSCPVRCLSFECRLFGSLPTIHDPPPLITQLTHLSNTTPDTYHHRSRTSTVTSSEVSRSPRSALSATWPSSPHLSLPACLVASSCGEMQQTLPILPPTSPRPEPIPKQDMLAHTSFEQVEQARAFVRPWGVGEAACCCWV